MKGNRIFLMVAMIVFVSCKKSETSIDIMTKTIHTIDTIGTIYYKQDMSRTNPQNTSETIKRYREMYFAKLISDSIVGVKGHWYMYVNDKENVIYEDIYFNSPQCLDSISSNRKSFWLDTLIKGKPFV